MARLFFSLIILSIGVLPSAQAATQTFSKVFIVILENTDYENAVQQEYLKEIAAKGALFEAFHAVARPSQPNYIALVGGDTLGVDSNDNFNLDATSVVDLLEEKGRSWKVYAEDYPGNCYKGASKGKYVRKHEPFISFKNISQNAARCANIVDATQMKADYQANRLADFVFYVPNVDNDGHDTDVSYADKWLKRTFRTMVNDASFLKDRLFVVTFDEGAKSSPQNHIYTAFVGEHVVPGSRSSTTYDLYSLLRTVEVAMGLGDLGRRDKEASEIKGIWRSESSDELALP